MTTLLPIYNEVLTEAQIRIKEGVRQKQNSELRHYNDVRKLMWIKKNPVYNLALEEWDRKEKLLTERVERMEKRSGDLKNEIYQLVGFFSVFQGVVLTAVTQLAQSSNDVYNCKRVWSPVILSALAWAVTSVGVWQKLSRIQLIDDAHFDEDESRREAVACAMKLRRLAWEFNLSDITEKTKRKAPKQYFGLRLSFWIKRFGVIVVTLSVFTGVFIASYFLIMCNRGMAPINLSTLHIPPSSP